MENVKMKNVTKNNKDQNNGVQVNTPAQSWEMPPMEIAIYNCNEINNDIKVYISIKECDLENKTFLDIVDLDKGFSNRRDWVGSEFKKIKNVKPFFADELILNLVNEKRSEYLKTWEWYPGGKPGGLFHLEKSISMMLGRSYEITRIFNSFGRGNLALELTPNGLNIPFR